MRWDQYAPAPGLFYGIITSARCLRPRSYSAAAPRKIPVTLPLAKVKISPP